MEELKHSQLHADHGHDHEHHHDHEHDHEHHHGHCDGHHHHHDSKGERIVENSLTYSREGTLRGGETGLEQAVDQVRSALFAAGQLVAVEGIIPGHIKALLRCGNVRCVLSVTRPDCCDILWPADREITGVWELTVNVISAIRPPEDPDRFIRALFI